MVANTTLFLNKFTQRLANIDMQTWQESLTSSSRLDVYRSIKSDFNAENYLEEVDGSYFRSLITKLRDGMLPLLQNTGQYNNLPPDKKLCPLCSRSLDDQYHLLLVCDKLKNIRRSILPNSMTVNPTSEKFRNISRKQKLP